MNEVATVQRQLRHLLLGDHLTERWVSGFNSNLLGADFDRRSNGRGVERKVDFALLVNLQPYIFLLGGLKALSSTRMVYIATGSSGTR